MWTNEASFYFSAMLPVMYVSFYVLSLVLWKSYFFLGGKDGIQNGLSLIVQLEAKSSGSDYKSCCTLWFEDFW